MTEQKEAAGEKPAAKIVSSKARSTTVELDWPVEFDGKVWNEITIRRVTGREVEVFIEAITEKADGESRTKFPGIECPQEGYDALDDDDRLRLEDELRPFLPRRLTQVAGLTQETTGSSSGK
jgi:hypothetical protein